MKKLNPFWLTDSRQVLVPGQSVFFAIRGDHHDGHQFIGDLYAQGVRQFVVDRPVADADQYVDAQFIVVDNVLAFMQQEAAKHRQQFSIPVVGITGSNGKTIVKEWLAQLLGGGSPQPDFVVVRSPKSYNSQVGVPLSVRQLTAAATIGVFEAGISRPHEMAALEAIIQPTIGILTNIGTAHDEGFKTLRQKVAEKLRLFTRVQTLVYCLDNEVVANEVAIMLRAVNPAAHYIGWSAEGHAEAAFWTTLRGDQLTLTRRADSREWTIQTPFTDAASVENLTHALLTLLSLKDVAVDDLNQRVARLRPVQMRLELKQGINRCVLIDDSYNNDVAGLRLALDFQKQQSSCLPKTVILSDVLQSGQDEADLYAFIGTLLAEQGVSQVIGIGPVISRNARFFGQGARFYPDTDAFLAQFSTDSLQERVVLIKGARAFSFERIVNRLQEKVHGTVLHIDLDALTHNLNYYREKVGSQTRLMVMVKAFAYGSGSAEVARLLQFHRIDYLAVAYADEGVFLRQQGITLPIMVMNPAPETFQTLIDNNLEPEIYSMALLREWMGKGEERREGGTEEQETKSTSSSFPPFSLSSAPPSRPFLHLKIDTGMHRLGFLPEEIPAVVDYLKQHPNWRVATVFSHLVGADEARFNDFSRQQAEVFGQAVAVLEAGLGYRPVRHLLNSAGIVRFPEYTLDMVRVGIGLYGVESSQLEASRVRTVGTLSTTISQIKTVKAGETVGYSRSGELDHDARIATLAIGYADGFDRRLGKGMGQVWVNGVLCPTVGNVCMDMTMIDVTGASAAEGDRVEIFGPNLPVTTLAQQMNTIPYEVLTGISERVKRVFYSAG
ncbi:bifunctional UDP-N-acetylmuramoyl-tripeptide:D-alanyl-D-alanine ligase/alanine racemase [Fibrella sp. HMF5335]|uniref:Alanine racemase n=1 Tax=Fibrella rubiginis TaxID=2817060 RepID=A0A939GN40_9BACT|nr:bifunctional UDP-N-acetylmuramoyl-tripeptide:D-alanyl-D-alanine ligase/alanine racemase [Fibrella rubiginis]MBO0939855.1 bifunctional UDP-N-acetylmuramoyl-tripeptide:D-alanyl-D-alanine ligase/alanine racemase [Fibrella rubiginis]